MTTKTCTKCGETKSTDQFYNDRSRRDGLRSRCKICLTAYNRAYYEANQDKITARQRAHYEANRDKITARQRAYNEANRDKATVYRHARYALVGDPSNERSQEVTARYATRTGEPWTKEEDRYILTGPGTNLDKALQLSRTYNAVKRRAAKLRRQEQAA